ncbi:MAG: lytic transglycosylase domain-containing protein [Actinobacteria bacterium]|nr:lytic transglycosylase domain-containing protein [Actinomycetota bacterium]
MTSRSRRRRRLLLRLVVPLVVVVGLGIGAYLVISARAVIPAVSGKLYPIHYQKGIERVADRYHVDPYLVAAVVRTESDYDARAVSHAGAVGLMQLMPETAQWIVHLDSWQGPANPTLTNPDDNLELGSCYLAYLIERFAKDLRAAVAAYNAGQGAVDNWLAASNGGKLQLDDIRFEETRDFVQKVEHYRDLYTRIHPGIFAEAAERV